MSTVIIQGNETTVEAVIDIAYVPSRGHHAGGAEMTTWRILLIDEMDNHGEALCDIVSNTMTQDQMDVEFDDDYGSEEGIPFTVWTQKRVYFPVCYDGSEWVSSASRAPDGVPTWHVGG